MRKIVTTLVMAVCIGFMGVLFSCTKGNESDTKGENSSTSTIYTLVGTKWMHSFSSGYVMLKFISDESCTKVEFDNEDGGYGHEHLYNYTYNAPEGTIIERDGEWEYLVPFIIEGDVLTLYDPDGGADKYTKQ